MFPVIHLFNFSIYPYGMMIGIGLVTAILFFMRRCKNRGYNEEIAFNLAIISSISGIIGAKLFYIIIELPQFLKNPGVMFKEFGAGFVVYGGIIFGILAAVWYTRIKKWPFLKIFDIAVPLIAMAQGFGRIGCFFAGCCYGRETSSFIGVEFNNSPYAPHGIHIIPTQLISSLGDFAIFGALLWFDNRKKRRDGQTGALYLILYSIGRFIIEIFRDDPRGTIFSIFSTSQFICIFTLIVGVVMYYKVSIKGKDLTPAFEGNLDESKVDLGEPEKEIIDEQVEEIKTSEIIKDADDKNFRNLSD